jgi:hypothetical protein
MDINDSEDSIQVSSASGEKDWFRVDLDSHANTCCVGSGVLIVNQTDRTARVSPFLKSLGSVSKVPIVSAAIAYDHPTPKHRRGVCASDTSSATISRDD